MKKEVHAPPKQVKNLYSAEYTKALKMFFVSFGHIG
jgi:hypothetical protein